MLALAAIAPTPTLEKMSRQPGPKDQLGKDPMLSACPDRYYDIQGLGPYILKLPEDLLSLAAFIIFKYPYTISQKTRNALNYSFPQYKLKTADVDAIYIWLGSSQFGSSELGKRIFEYNTSMKPAEVDKELRQWRTSLHWAGII